MQLNIHTKYLISIVKNIGGEGGDLILWAFKTLVFITTTLRLQFWIIYKFVLTVENLIVLKHITDLKHIQGIFEEKELHKILNIQWEMSISGNKPVRHPRVAHIWMMGPLRETCTSPTYV